jgi:hypothetical protein
MYSLLFIAGFFIAVKMQNYASFSIKEQPIFNVRISLPEQFRICHIVDAVLKLNSQNFNLTNF